MSPPAHFCDFWGKECNDRSHTPSPAVFSPSTDCPSGSPQGGCTGLRDPAQPLTSQQGRADMVGHSDGEVEWEIGVDQGSTDLTIDSDASNLGWGAFCQEMSTGGLRYLQEKTRHINCLELIAATLALKTFVKNKTGLSVLLRIDNTTAVAYINNQRGTVSEDLIHLTRDLWMWCLKKSIHIHAQYLPGNLNTVADRESRSLRDRSD